MARGTQLSVMLEKLAEAGINIEFVYGSAAAANALSTIIMGVSDVASAVKVKL